MRYQGDWKASVRDGSEPLPCKDMGDRGKVNAVSEVIDSACITSQRNSTAITTLRPVYARIRDGGDRCAPRFLKHLFVNLISYHFSCRAVSAMTRCGFLPGMSWVLTDCFHPILADSLQSECLTDMPRLSSVGPLTIAIAHSDHHQLHPDEEEECRRSPGRDACRDPVLSRYGLPQFRNFAHTS